MPESKMTKLEEIQQDLSINDADLDGEMTVQAGLYAHYAALYARAQMKVDHAKIQMDIAKAKAYKRHRNRFTARGTKFTEPMIEAEILTDEEYIQSQQKHLAAKMNASIAKESLEALKQKKDMLIQKGVARREELKGELYVKNKSLDSQELRDMALKTVIKTQTN